MVEDGVHTNENQESTILDKVSNIISLIAVFAIFGILAIYAFNFFDHTVSQDTADWAVFGDFFGGVLGPILSFLSLMLVLVTIKQQKISLNQAAQQIQLSFDEMTKSVLAQEKQAEVAEAQLSNLVQKNESEDIVRVLREVLSDITSSLEESVVCYSVPAKTRKFKDQLFELSTPIYNKERQEHFVSYHESRIKILLSSIDYFKGMLCQLKTVDGVGIVHDYYENKLVVINEMTGLDKYRRV